MNKFGVLVVSAFSSAGGWNVLSQLSQSAISFCVVLAFAHILTPNEFGIVSAVAILLTVVMSMNRAVLGEQLLVLTESADVVDGYWKLQRYIFVFLTLLLLGVSYFFFEPAVALAAWFFLCYAISDAFRYALFSGMNSLKPRTIAVVDIARMLLAALALSVAILYEDKGVPIFIALYTNVPWLFYAFFMHRARRASAWNYLTSLGKYEFLISLQYILATAATQCLPIVSLSFAGAEIVGGIRLAQSILNPIAVLALAFQPTLIRRLASSSPATAVRTTRKLVVTAVLISMSLVIAAVFTKSTIVGLFVPAELQWIVSAVWIPVVLSTVAVIVGQPGGALVRVRKLGSISLTGQVVGAVMAYLTLTGVMLWGQATDISAAVATGGIGSVSVTYLLMFISIRRSNKSCRISSPD